MSSAYQPVPLQGYEESGIFDIDPEEEKIQQLRDRKNREDLERQINHRINQVINHNNNRLKEYVSHKYAG